MTDKPIKIFPDNKEDVELKKMGIETSFSYSYLRDIFISSKEEDARRQLECSLSGKPYVEINNTVELMILAATYSIAHGDKCIWNALAALKDLRINGEIAHD